MKQFLREPLLHFLVLGAGLFLAHGWLTGSGAFAGDSIVINQGQVEHLTAAFARLHQRPPTRHELDALVNDAIREEIFYREALAQGLDRDDVVVRRRLMQKLEFIAQDIEPVPEPTEAQLQQYLASNPGKFRIEPRYSFQQVYLNPQRHGTRLQAEAARLRADLDRRGGDAAKRGDPLLLKHSFEAADAAEVRRVFGAGFATALERLPPGSWQGPVASGYGAHLVRIERRDAGHVAPLQDVREQVRREWTYSRQQAANARFYAGLRQRYNVTVERPGTAGGSSALAAEMRQ